MPVDRQRLATVAIAALLGLVLGWNIYRAEVETRPAETPIGLQESTQTETVNSPWAPTPTAPPGP